MRFSVGNEASGTGSPAPTAGKVFPSRPGPSFIRMLSLLQLHEHVVKSSLQLDDIKPTTESSVSSSDHNTAFSNFLTRTRPNSIPNLIKLVMQTGVLPVSIQLVGFSILSSTPSHVVRGCSIISSTICSSHEAIGMNLRSRSLRIRTAVN